MKKLLLLGLVLSMSLLAAGCTFQEPINKDETMAEDKASGTTQTEVTQAPADMASSSAATTDKKVVRNITLDAFKFGYSQEQIEVKAGETISLTLTNSDGMHDFRIDELKVQTKVIKQGETDTVSFTIPEDAKGKTFEYYCGVMNHRAMGQVGKLVIN